MPESLRNIIDRNKLPKHIAVIMDGNGRWAEEQGEDRLFGHYNGVKSVREIVETSAELGIQFLTLYAFSTENWDRPEDEVKGLMALLVETIKKEVPTLNKNNIKLQVIGDTDMLPDFAKEELAEAIKLTENNTGLTLIMALSYSSRMEILSAVKRLAQDAKEGNIDIASLDHNAFNKYLYTHNFPDPELMIRTSGEYRISNFLLYQIAYTELYFTSTLWPEFRKEDLYKAIVDYQQRERRFGKTGSQIKAEDKVC